MAVDKKLYDELMALAKSDPQRFEQLGKTASMGQPEQPQQEGFLPRVGRGIQAMAQAAPSIWLEGKMPAKDTTTDFAEKLALEKYKAGLKGNKPIIKNVGGSLIQYDPDTEAVETLVEAPQKNYAAKSREEWLANEKEKASYLLGEQKFQTQQQEKETQAADQEEEIMGTAQDMLNTISEVKKGAKYFGPYGDLPTLATSLGGAVDYKGRSEWENNINKLLSAKVVDLILNMKKASKTGATGFGQLSEREGQLLREASTALKKTTADPQTALKYLNQMENLYKKIVSGKQMPQGNLGGDISSPIDAELSAAGYTPEQIAEYHKLKGQ